MANKSNADNIKSNRNAAKTLFRFLCIVLGLLLGAFLFFRVTLGKKYMYVPVFGHGDYDTVQLVAGKSISGGDVTSDWRTTSPSSVNALTVNCVLCRSTPTHNLLVSSVLLIFLPP